MHPHYRGPETKTKLKAPTSTATCESFFGHGGSCLLGVWFDLDQPLGGYGAAGSDEVLIDCSAQESDFGS